MSASRMNFDRYHPVMGNASLSDNYRLGNHRIAEMQSTFYTTQRKKLFAPCVGHERLKASLLKSRALDIPWLEFLRRDKAGLSRIANHLESSDFPFHIRSMAPGTIMFANEPFADITGPFALTQMMEVDFEHAFDEPVTVAANALKIRLAAGSRHVSDFSLRRNGSLQRGLEITRYAIIGGFDDTSNMEAAFQLNLNPVGTMAHYWIQIFFKLLRKAIPVTDNMGREKHFQQTAFEVWLDENPNGTTILIDTIHPRLGLIHAIRAAKSSEKRRKALKFIRLDSGNLGKGSRWIRDMLNANDMHDVGIMLTGDLEEEEIQNIIKICPEVNGFGVGTKLAAETTVAGVIFKLCLINNMPTLKCSATKGKETIPGIVQIWRCTDYDGFYVKDVISTIEESCPMGDYQSVTPLLKLFYETGKFMPIPSLLEQKQFVTDQLLKFKDIWNYPVELSPSLQTFKDRLIQKVQKDEQGEDGVVMIPYPD